jgi:hypothetical protein
MNIQALLGTRPATGSSRRPVTLEKGRERDRPGAIGAEPQDTVELSVEGKERAAADAQDGGSS